MPEWSKFLGRVLPVDDPTTGHIAGPLALKKLQAQVTAPTDRRALTIHDGPTQNLLAQAEVHHEFTDITALSIAA